jgi:hypothetical protein
MRQGSLKRDRQPGWSRTWQEKLSEVDDQILDYLRETGELTSESVRDITARIQTWFEGQQLDSSMRAELARLHGEQRLLHARIADRVNYIAQDEQFRLAHLLERETY